MVDLTVNEDCPVCHGQCLLSWPCLPNKEAEKAFSESLARLRNLGLTTAAECERIEPDDPA